MSFAFSGLIETVIQKDNSKLLFTAVVQCISSTFSSHNFTAVNTGYWVHYENILRVAGKH